MRKLFTLAAAVLASFSLWAAGTPIADLNFEIKTGDTELPSGYLYSSQNKPSIKVQNGITCIIISDGGGSTAPTISGTEEPTGGKRWMAFCPDADCNATFSIMSNKKEFFIQNKDGKFKSYTNTANAVEEVEVTGLKAGEWYALCGASSQVYIVKAEFEAGTPSTDPVTTATVTGPTKGFIGVPVTFTLTTDVKANAIKWFVDGAEQDGENSDKFILTPVAERTYRVLAEAKNDYNADFVVSNSIELVATEKPAATPCATLIPAAEGTNPAIGDKIILTEESFGGNIFVADMKAANDIKYNALGLLIGGGGKDSLRVELGHKIAVGTIISLKLAAAGTGNRGLKIQTLGHSTIFDASWSAAAAEELNAFEYEVKAGDKLIGESKFLLARNNSVYLQEVSVSDCGEELAPVTNPVTAVTVAGPETGFVGQTYSFKGTADADADDWIWYVNDIAVDGAKAATFAFTPDAVGTYRIMAGARNGYNPEDGWINSAEVSIVISEALEQVSVSASTEWDWTKAASVNEIKLDDSTTPKKNEEVLLANISGMNNNADFNAQALLFSGEYPVRDGKYCQGSYLKFNTTVAGWVQLDFSNTGGKDGDRPKRYVAVNGVVNTEVGSDTGNKVESARIPVEAGNVEVAGAFEDGTAQYLRIYKLTFSTSDIAEGIENIDASAKAVKIIYNGQLLIKKGDVFYNAQGAIVK